MIKERILKEKIIVVIREETFEKALNISEIAITSGIKIIEITYTTPNAGKVIKILKDKYPNILVGSGSVVTKKDALNTIKNSGDFIVAPGFSEVVSKVCKENKILYIPGSITPTEFLTAYNEGWDFIKVFPLTFVGKNYIKSISKAMPYLTFMGTGGVSNENISSWINSGISSFGLGGSLTTGTKEEVETKIKKLKEIINVK